MRTKFLMGEAADYIRRKEYPYYENEMMELIPSELLDSEMNSGNYRELVQKLDALRFEKQRELENILNDPDAFQLFIGLSVKIPLALAKILKSPKRLDKIINAPRNSLPKALENKRKEITFLFQVACAIGHWQDW